MQSGVSNEQIVDKIFFIRGKKVMIDKDLAELYRVEVKRLKEAVRRNIRRFPADFMFQMNKREMQNWRTQIASSNNDRMGLRHLPFCFTEQGVTMLPCVLNSELAIRVNIRIIRIFIQMREVLSTNKDILLKLEQLEKKIFDQEHRLNKNEKETQLLFNALKSLVQKQLIPRKKIGFRINGKY